MENIDFNLPEGRQLLKDLYAFTYVLYKRLYKTKVNGRGKSFKDYVHDAIEKHLRGQDNYDPSRAPLDYHLKFNIIRRNLYNDLPPDVKRIINVERANPKIAEMTQMIPEQPSEIEPISDMFINPEELDNKLIFDEIEKEINGDDILERMYLAIVHDGFDFNDRQEICIEYEISPAAFDNGKRRFMTRLTKVFKKLKLI